MKINFNKDTFTIKAESEEEAVELRKNVIDLAKLVALYLGGELDYVKVEKN